MVIYDNGHIRVDMGCPEYRMFVRVYELDCRRLSGLKNMTRFVSIRFLCVHTYYILLRPCVVGMMSLMMVFGSKVY